MNKILEIVIIAIFICCNISSTSLAQQISVKSFEKMTNDLEARINSIEDQNGDKCALIKIETFAKGFSFDGGMMSIKKIKQDIGEIWIYVSPKSKSLTIKHAKYGILRNYLYPEIIESQIVYVMQLTLLETKPVIESIKTAWVTIKTEPSEAEVYIDDLLVGQTPFTRELSEGKHSYRLNKKFYFPEFGYFSLKEIEEQKTINVQLKPNFGTVSIESSPENDADIIINGKPTDKKTPFTFNKLSPGEYTFTIHKLWFEPVSEKINIAPNDNFSKSFSMKPTFADVTITTSPQADIYIDNEKEGYGSLTKRLSRGNHAIEARKDNYRSDIQNIKINGSETIKVELFPQEKYGSLVIKSSPKNTLINIDGTDKGTTPKTIKQLPIGTYAIILSKYGYTTVSKTITITENKRTLLKMKLPNKESLYNRRPKAVISPYKNNLPGVENWGIGFGNKFIPSDFKQILPPISVAIDFAANEKFTIGAIFGCSYAEKGNWEYSNFIICGRGTYHFYSTNKFDFYSGFLLGWNKAKAEYVEPSAYSSPIEPSMPAPNKFVKSVFIGSRFFFSNTFGIFAEYGYGLSNFNFGFSIVLPRSRKENKIQ